MIPNPQQQAIIDHVDGPCIVTAVPGSGKTASITERTKNLVRLGKNPASILAITFTNKAAKEMRSRIGAAVGEDTASRMTISTFHSLCAKIIRENASLLGLRHNYTIYDADEQEKLLKSCMFRVEGDEFKIQDSYFKPVMACIEGMRNSCLDETAAFDKYDIDGNQPKVIEAYLDALKDGNAIDFTGLLSETLRLLTEHPDVRAKYSKRWRYISVDEVQDTNIAQYRLMTLLASEHKNIIAVGDLSQAVYSFRGASPENVMRFANEFGAKVLRIETNYRSTPEILKYSQTLIENNALRIGTILRTDNPSGDEPKAIRVEREEAMAEEVARDILRRIRGGTPPTEVAILYRTNYVSRVLEMALRRYRIKYRIIGGLSFWDRREVKLSLGILKFMANPSDGIAFESVVEACCRGIGPKGIMAITDRAKADGADILATCKAIVDEHGGLAKNLDSTMAVLCSQAEPYQKLRLLLSRTAFGGKLAQDSTSENDRVANVEEVARDLEGFMSPKGALVDYLQSISLLNSSDEESEVGEVSLMTMHACKGLEFDAVFISHACDGIIPHKRCLEGEPEDCIRQLEEERRLMYVAMTRARKFLRIYFCGIRGKQTIHASRFIKESGIPTYKLGS